nr:putative lipase rog1 [Quercus suber]
MGTTTQQGNVASNKCIANGKNEPDHLLVLVHGIMASPSDWLYVEAELKKRLGRNFLIYASSSNTFTKTFSGIDGAGKRLADEVMQVVQKTESLKRISFLAHSLGGLFARYAISVLYTPHGSSSGKPDDPSSSNVEISQAECSSRREKLALPLAPIIVGQTGSQLFLTNGKPEKPPLLLRMASDCEDGKFISALGTFRSRILYANVSYDLIPLHYYSFLS